MTNDIFRTNGVLASPERVSAALAVLRVIVGITFIAHGAQKLFVFGIDGVTAGFAQIGVPLPGIVGPLVALVELFGGAALVAGLLTRLASAGLGVIMIGAIFLVHLPAGYFLPDGVEFAVVLLAASLTLLVAGPGLYSADALLARRGASDRSAEPAASAWSPAHSGGGRSTTS